MALVQVRFAACSLANVIVMVCVIILFAVMIENLSQEELSDDFFKPEGLESNSLLDNSRVAATSHARDVALVLKYVPIQVFMW